MPNTDNKINRFVTFFALALSHLDSFVSQDKPGPLTCFLYNFVYLDLLPARNKPCTATLVKLRKLVPGLAKNAPCFVHYGCVPGLYPEDKFVVTTCILSATPTNFIAGPLGVSGCLRVHLDLFNPTDKQHIETYIYDC